MNISYSADIYDTLGYGIVSFRPWEKECAIAAVEKVRQTFGLPNNVDVDGNEIYFEVDDRHLFYGEIRSYFYKAVSMYYDRKRAEKKAADEAKKAAEQQDVKTSK